MSRQGSGAEPGRQADQQNLAQRPQPWDKGSLGRKPPCRLPVTKWSSDCPSRHWQGPATRGSSGQQLLFNYLVLTQNTGSQTGSGERIIYSFVEPSSHSREMPILNLLSGPALGGCWEHEDKEDSLPWSAGVVHSFSQRQMCKQIKIRVLRFLSGYFHGILASRRGEQYLSSRNE